MPIDEFLDIEADVQAKSEMRIERSIPAMRRRYKAILDNPANRDPEVFRYLGVDPSVTLRDYEAVPVEDRGPNWVAGLSALFVAARLQTWVNEHGLEALREYAAGAKRIDSAARKLTRSELTQAAKIGVSNERLEKAKGSNVLNAAKGLDTLDDFPSPNELRRMTQTELLQSLEERGVISPVRALQMQGMAAAARFAELQPGSVEFAEESKAALEAEVNEIKYTNRQILQAYATLFVIGGKSSTRMIWVAEGDKNTCGNCAAKAGRIETYKTWKKLGLPGPSTCKGGRKCRCDLVRV